MTASILDLIQQNGGSLKRVSTTGGGEWAGACPGCGGKDRFRVWPDNGRYWCRGCGKKGDLIQYLRDFRGMGFREAASLTGKLINHRKPASAQKSPVMRRSWTPSVCKPPSNTWRQKAALCVEWAQKQLQENQQALEYLHKRGLNDDTIRAARLGWIPGDIYRQRKTWGLDENGKHLWLPEGLLIPVFIIDEVWRLRVRRPEGEPRYVLIPGSDTSPMFIIGFENNTIVVESELDTLLINQEAGDIVSEIALGSSTIRPDEFIHDLLNKSKKVLLSLDYDPAGGKEAWNFWRENYRAERWPVPKGKDPTDYFQQGGSIREWILAAIHCQA